MRRTLLLIVFSCMLAARLAAGIAATSGAGRHLLAQPPAVTVKLTKQQFVQATWALQDVTCASVSAEDNNFNNTLAVAVIGDFKAALTTAGWPNAHVVAVRQPCSDSMRDGVTYASFRVGVRLSGTSTTQVRDDMWTSIGSPQVAGLCTGGYNTNLYANVAKLFAQHNFKVSQNNGTITNMFKWVEYAGPCVASPGPSTAPSAAPVAVNVRMVLSAGDLGCAAAGSACAAGPSSLSDGTCIAPPAANTYFSCGCVTGATWCASARRCVDVNECAAPNPCLAVANSNTTCYDAQAPNSGYTCACDAGTEWNGTACADIDGCAGSNPCQAVANSNGICIDVPAPGTGFKCGCTPSSAWDPATPARPGACVACMSVVAGQSGRSGYSGDGGPATQARLHDPYDVSVDAVGNIYIADEYNSAIRRVDAATGTITTLVGRPTLDSPVSVLAARDGNIYFTGAGNKLYTYSPATNTTTSVTLSGPANSSLGGLAMHPTSGLIHVLQPNLNGTAVLRVDPSSPLSSSKVVAFIARRYPYFIAFNPFGDAFMPASNTGFIYKWSGGPNVTKWNTGSASATTGAVATDVYFQSLFGVAFDSAGNMLVGDLGASRVWLVDAHTGQLSLVAGDGTRSLTQDGSDPRSAPLFGFSAAAFGPGDRSAYIADTYHGRILKVMLNCAGA